MESVKYEVVDNIQSNLFNTTRFYSNTDIPMNVDVPDNVVVDVSDNVVVDVSDNVVVDVSDNVSPILSDVPVDNGKNIICNQMIEYIKNNTPHICILTPCFGGQCHTGYTASLIETVLLFTTIKLSYQIEFCKNDSLVSRARNNLVAKALSAKHTTHVIFIDADISWDPIDILKLILSDKPVIGGVYPLKRYNWDNLLKDPVNPYNNNIIQTWISAKNSSQLSFMRDIDTIQAKLLKYNINYIDSTLNIDNNLAQVRHLATGFMMIKRTVFEQLFEAHPSSKYTDDVGFLTGDENNTAFALFDCGVENNHYYSEDWLFCHRWSAIGGGIWIDVSIGLTHTGVEDYQGSYISTLIA
jgi:hypothetical protein